VKPAAAKTTETLETEGAATAAAETEGAAAAEAETPIAEQGTLEPGTTEVTEPGVAVTEFTVPAESPDAAASTTITQTVEEPRWRVDDILLESPRSLTDGKYGPGGADMTPYERFF
jgi:hypothetical protein